MQVGNSSANMQIKSWDNIGDNQQAHFDPKTKAYGENNKPYGTIMGLLKGQISLKAYFCPNQAKAEDRQATLNQIKQDIKAAYPDLAKAVDKSVDHVVSNGQQLTGAVLKGLKVSFDRLQKAQAIPGQDSAKEVAGAATSIFSKIGGAVSNIASRAANAVSTAEEQKELSAKLKGMQK